MNRAGKYANAGAEALALAGAAFGAAIVLGVLPFEDSDEHRPCDQLPQTVQVRSAIEPHAARVDTPQGQGDEVSVSIGTPCSSSAAASLAQVTLGNFDERSRIEKLLARSEALACPFRSCTGRSSISQPSTASARTSP